jgi:amidase
MVLEICKSGTFCRNWSLLKLRWAILDRKLQLFPLFFIFLLDFIPDFAKKFSKNTKFMKNFLYLLFFVILVSCQRSNNLIPAWEAYDESAELAENADNQSRRLRYKLIQSQVTDKNNTWKQVAPQLRNFTGADYERLKPLIYEQNIPALQAQIESGDLTYEKLTQWYLYRITLFENNPDRYLNAIISINPNAVSEARKRDKNRSTQQHPIFGMPILLKDNINMEGLPTTAGAYALLNNKTEDAFIVDRIQEKGGIILGKANLSEWANYLCLGCPNGYSAVGGQTLNAYGRKVFDTGGSSSGSGAAMAANYAAAAVGTETSGSILSPSSKSSLVGLKPTIGLLSRGGIVPISGTLDTPGPMTRSVIDNAILLSAMSGEDPMDTATKDNPKNKTYWQSLEGSTLKGKRFGVTENALKDPLYQKAVEKLKAAGAEIIEFEPIEVDFSGFGILLSADMKIDLPAYLATYGSKAVQLNSVADVVNYNLQDSTIRSPYGQGRFAGILDVELSANELETLKTRLNKEGVRYFEAAMAEHQLDAVLSIDNRGAGFAAAAKYPCLTLPMGYTGDGEPRGLTFIGRPFTEDQLLKMAYAYEQASKARKAPADFK